MLQEKTVNKKLFIILGMIIAITAILFCNSQTAYAGEEDKNVNEEATLGDYEDRCNEWRTSHTTFNADEAEWAACETRNTWHVKDGKFNVISFDRYGKHFDVDYDYRGYYGDRKDYYGRKANIQYFYNSQTKVLHLLCMDGSDIGYQTYNYGPLYLGDTALEDEIEYEDGAKAKLSTDIKHVVLDTELTCVSNHSLQCLYNLETVDILGKLYNESKFKYLATDAFKKCGINNAIENHRVRMDILLAKDAGTDHVYMCHHWCDQAKIIYGNPIGKIKTTTEKDLYAGVDLRNYIESDYANEKNVSVTLNEDFDINSDNIKIPEGLTVNLNLNNHKLFTCLGQHHDAFFHINGRLELHDGEVIEHFDNLGPLQDRAPFIVHKKGSVKVDDVSFNRGENPRSVDLHTHNGGAFNFDVVSANSEFNNCKFNTAGKNGGAIYIDDYDCYNTGKTITFNNCEFNNCNALSKGGAVHNDSKYVNLEFNNTKFTSCNANAEGGAISTVGNNSNVTLNNCSIEKCIANGGAAIYNYSNTSNYIFNHTNINECFSKAEGGAIYSSADNENYYFSDSSINNCKSREEGGAIYVRSSDCKIYGCDLSTLEPKDANFVIENCSADTEGGAIYTSGASSCGNQVYIKHIKFSNNKANNYGGALSFRGRNNQVEDCSFDSNSVNPKEAIECGGGAIAVISGGSDYHTLIKNCVFENNYCKDKGTTFYLDDKSKISDQSANNIIKCQDPEHFTFHLNVHADYDLQYCFKPVKA